LFLNLNCFNSIICIIEKAKQRYEIRIDFLVVGSRRHVSATIPASQA
jgi:hypothetical protein